MEVKGVGYMGVKGVVGLKAGDCTQNSTRGGGDQGVGGVGVKGVGVVG